MTDPLLTKYTHDLRVADALAIEAKASGTGLIEGLASTYGGEPDRQGDIVLPGAFRATLAAHKAAGTAPAMLWAHQMERPVGRWLAIDDDPAGLRVKGQFNLKTEAGREAFEHAKAGDVGAFSIGFIVPEGGREYAGNGCWHLKRIDLAEISLVAAGANPRARVTSVKHIGSKAEAVEFLRAAGMAKDAARRFAAGGFPALDADDPDLAEKAAHLAAHLDAAINRMRQK